MDQSQDITGLTSKHEEIELVYLFGSAISGYQHSESDIDIAVLIDDNYWQDISGKLDYKSALIVELQESLQSDRIDLVVLNEAPPLLANQVVSTGKVVYCKDNRRKNNFIVHTKKRYLDTKPLREIMRRYLYKRIEDGEFGRVAEK